MRLVVDAGAAHAAGEIDQRLLLGQPAEHFHGGFQRGQFAVGIEDIELAIVGGVRRAGIASLSPPVLPLDMPDIADGEALMTFTKRSRSSVKSWRTSGR